MLKLGELYYHNIIYPQDETDNYPTLEGVGLLNAANAKGIIKLPHETQDDDNYND